MGEIDLIMADGRAVVFVEVKTRSDSSENFLPAQSAVTPAKRKRIIRTAGFFCKKYAVRNRPLRFDVTAVVYSDEPEPVIRHYKNAFTTA